MEIEFKSGILNFDPINKKVSADKRLGKIKVIHVNYNKQRRLIMKNTLNGLILIQIMKKS